MYEYCKVLPFTFAAVLTRRNPLKLARQCRLLQGFTAALLLDLEAQSTCKAPLQVCTSAPAILSPVLKFVNDEPHPQVILRRQIDSN
jgi:hypothetical protein